MGNRLIRTAGIGAIATAMSVGVASAADVAPIVVPVTTPVVVAPVPAGFDFAGPYVGVVGGPVFLPGVLSIDWINVQAQVGFNVVRGRVLLGAEVKLGAYALSLQALAVDADARVGFLLRDNILAYATAGGGFYDVTFGSPHINFGGGIEVGFGSRISMQLEVGGEWFPGYPIYPRVEFGFNVQLGR